MNAVTKNKQTPKGHQLMNTQIVVHPYNATLFIDKKEWTTDSCEHQWISASFFLSMNKITWYGCTTILLNESNQSEKVM